MKNKASANGLRFLSVFLATVMMIAMIPVTAAAEGEVMEYSGASRSYNFRRAQTSANLDGSHSVDFTSNTAYDAGRGRYWAYLDTTAPRAISGGTYQIVCGNDYAYSYTSLGNWIAIKINVPAQGRYRASLQHAFSTTGGITGVYVTKYTEGMARSDYESCFANPDNKVGEVNSYTSGATYNGETILNDVDFADAGDYLVVFYADRVAPGGTYCYMYPSEFVLDGVALGTPSITIGKNSLLINEKTKVNASVKLNDGNDADNTTIAYSSSNQDIAIVDAEGNVTAINEGTANIIATITRQTLRAGNEETETKVVSVPLSVEKGLDYSGVSRSYNFRRAKTDVNTDGSTSANLTSITAYDTGKGRYWAYLDSQVTSLSGGYQVACLDDFAQTYTAVGEWFALKVNVPAQGRYRASLQHWVASSGGIAGVYVTKYTEGMTRSDYENCFADSNNKVGEVNFYSSSSYSSESSINDVQFTESGDYVIIFYADRNAPGGSYCYMFPAALTLDGIAFNNFDLSFNAQNQLAVGDSQQLNISNGKLNNNNSIDLNSAAKRFVSSSPSIISVNESTGLATAVAPGTATLRAYVTVNGITVSKMLNVTITKPTFTAPAEGSVLVNTTGNVTNSVLAAKVNNITGGINFGSETPIGIGSDVEITAQKAVDNKNFLYWKDNSGRIVGTGETYTFKMGTNTLITAVYSPAPTDDQVLVEFIDRNGKVLKSDYVSKTTVITPPANPYSIGYVFKDWMRATDTTPEIGALAVNNATYLANYTKDETPYTISVNGGTIKDGGATSGTFEYNTKVTVVADTSVSSFAYWERAGKIISYDYEYSFYVWDSAELTARTKADGDTINKVPHIVMDVPKVVGNRVIFCAERIVPENLDYELIETGILFDDTTDPTLDGGYDSKAVARNTNGTIKQFTARKDNVSGTIYGRAYMIYKDGIEYKVIYSETVSGTV